MKATRKPTRQQRDAKLLRLETVLHVHDFVEATYKNVSNRHKVIDGLVSGLIKELKQVQKEKRNQRRRIIVSARKQGVRLVKFKGKLYNEAHLPLKNNNH